MAGEPDDREKADTRVNMYLVIALILLLVAFLGRSRLSALRGGRGTPAPVVDERHTAPLAESGRSAHLETAATRTAEPPAPLAAPMPTWSEPAISEPAISEPGWPMPGEIAGASWAPAPAPAPEPAPFFEEQAVFADPVPAAPPAPEPAPAPVAVAPPPAPVPPPEPVAAAPIAVEPVPVEPIAVEQIAVADPIAHDETDTSEIPVWQPPAEEAPALEWEHPVPADPELVAPVVEASPEPALEWIGAAEPADPADEVVAWIAPVEEPVAPVAEMVREPEPDVAVVEPELPVVEPEPVVAWTPPVAPEPVPEPEPAPAIVVAVARATATLTAFCDQEGVTPRMFAVMAALADGPLSVNDQATRHGVSRPVVAGLCGRLEALGLAEKIRDERDKRRVRVGLTEAGRRIIETAAA